jgi:hypothetical protein
MHICVGVVYRKCFLKSRELLTTNITPLIPLVRGRSESPLTRGLGVSFFSTFKRLNRLFYPVEPFKEGYFRRWS